MRPYLSSWLYLILFLSTLAAAPPPPHRAAHRTLPTKAVKFPWAEGVRRGILAARGRGIFFEDLLISTRRDDARTIRVKITLVRTEQSQKNEQQIPILEIIVTPASTKVCVLATAPSPPLRDRNDDARAHAAASALAYIYRDYDGSPEDDGIDVYQEPDGWTVMVNRNPHPEGDFGIVLNKSYTVISTYSPSAAM